MKSKVKRGKGARGAAEYVLDPEKGAEIVGGNCVGTTPRQVGREIGRMANLRPDAKRHVLHTSLALPVGENLSSEQWHEVARQHLINMGINPDNRPWIAVRHTDTDKDHIHILTSRIDFNKDLWLGQFEARLAIESTQSLERQFGLTITPGLDSDAEGTKITQAEIEMALASGETPPRELVFESVKYAAQGNPTVTQFVERLGAAGITVVPNISETTMRLNGFAFGLRGHENASGEPVFFKGSDLGKGKNKLTWGNLQKIGIEYEQARDGEFLVGLKKAAADEQDKLRNADSGVGHDNSPESSQSDGGFDSDRRESKESGSEHGIQNGDGGSENRSGRREDNPRSSKRDPQGEHSEEASIGVDGFADSSVEAELVPDRLERWNDANSVVADLAAPITSSVVSNRNELTADHKTKLDAWVRQHNALRAPAYRITLKSRNDDLKSFVYGKNSTNESPVFTASEVAEKIGQLRRHNARGYDVYITPIDDNHHYLVVDDMTAEKMERFKAQGFGACLVQESSHDNQQAIIKVPRDSSRKNEQSLANKIVGQINADFGDPKFTGVIHPFRMAGFANKKPGRANAFTRVIESAHRICAKVADWLSDLRSQSDVQMQLVESEREQSRRIINIDSAPDDLRSVVGQGDDARYRVLFKQHLNLAKSKGWEVDYSRIDYRIAVEMLKHGANPHSVAGAIERNSPELADRHNDTRGYCERTVSAANGSSDVAKALQQRNDRGLDDDNTPKPKP